MDEIFIHINNIPVIFPVHPRTAKVLKKIDKSYHHLHLIEPLGYLEFNFLVEHCMAVITDSGGITEETAVMGIPCMTLRDNTERPETISMGTNELVETNPKAIGPYFEKLIAGKWKKGIIPEFWDGKAAERIIDKIVKMGNVINKDEL